MLSTPRVHSAARTPSLRHLVTRRGRKSLRHTRQQTVRRHYTPRQRPCTSLCLGQCRMSSDQSPGWDNRNSMVILQRNDILEKREEKLRLPYRDPTQITRWGRLHGLEEINMSSTISIPIKTERENEKTTKPSTSRPETKHQPRLPAEWENPPPDTSALGPLTWDMKHTQGDTTPSLPSSSFPPSGQASPNSNACPPPQCPNRNSKSHRHRPPLPLPSIAQTPHPWHHHPSQPPSASTASLPAVSSSERH